MCPNDQELELKGKIRFETIPQKTSPQTSTSTKKPDTVASSDTNNTKKKENISLGMGKDGSFYIPTGAIAKATLITGIIAPTMSKAKDFPMPVILRVTDLSILANDKRQDLKGCVILGNGVGDLASERVHVKIDNITCITKKNEIYDSGISGLITASDSKPGLPGEVVYKANKAIAGAIIASFLDGVGKAFSTNGQTVMTSALGTTTTSDVDSKEVMKGAAFSGASSAASLLAKQFLKIADATEPVIEVLGSKDVDFIVTKGTMLSRLKI